MGSNHLTSTLCNCSFPSGTTSGVAENMLTSSPGPSPCLSVAVTRPCPLNRAHESSSHMPCAMALRELVAHGIQSKACNLYTVGSSPNPKPPSENMGLTSVDRSPCTCHRGHRGFSGAGACVLGWAEGGHPCFLSIAVWHFTKTSGLIAAILESCSLRPRQRILINSHLSFFPFNGLYFRCPV